MKNIIYKELLKATGIIVSCLNLSLINFGVGPEDDSSEDGTGVRYDCDKKHNCKILVQAPSGDEEYTFNSGGLDSIDGQTIQNNIKIHRYQLKDGTVIARTSFDGEPRYIHQKDLQGNEIKASYVHNHIWAENHHYYEEVHLDEDKGLFKLVPLGSQPDNMDDLICHVYPFPSQEEKYMCTEAQKLLQLKHLTLLDCDTLAAFCHLILKDSGSQIKTEIHPLNTGCRNKNRKDCTGGPHGTIYKFPDGTTVHFHWEQGLKSITQYNRFDKIEVLAYYDLDRNTWRDQGNYNLCYREERHPIYPGIFKLAPLY